IAIAGARAKLELRVIDQVREVAQLALDQRLVAGQPGTQRLAQTADRLELLGGQAFRAQLVAERQEIRSGRLQALARFLEALRIAPESVRIRAPNVAAVRVVEAAARPVAASADIPAGVRTALVPSSLVASPLRAALLPALSRLIVLLPGAQRRIRVLSGLPFAVAGRLLRPESPARLAGSRIEGIARPAHQIVQLPAQRSQLREQLGARILVAGTAGHRFLGRALEGLARALLEVPQRGGRHGIRCRGFDAVALADHLGRDAEPRDRLRLLQLRQGARQRLGRARRLAAELLRDALHVLLEGLELAPQRLLALADVERGAAIDAAANAAIDPRVERVAHRALQLGGELALPAIQIRRPIREIRERLARLQLTLRGHLLERLLQLAARLLDRALRLRRIDLFAAARGPIHGTQRLVELTQRLGGRIAALAAAAGLRARLLARLALLPFLALLALLTLLPRLTLLRGLRLLLRELLLHLLELAAKLLGLAAELLLLPAVALGQLLAAIRLTREVLLTAGELLKLADRLVDAALLLLERDRRFRLVLVLLEIHLELEQLGQIPPGEPAATAAVALERNLDVGEKRLGAQQMLQRRLLGRDRVLKLHSLEIFRRRIHRLGRELEAFDELPDLLVLARQLSRARAVRERARLLGQRAL